MIGGIGIRLAPETLTPALARAELFLATDVHHDPRNRKAESLVRTATPLDEATLRRLMPDDFRSETAVEYSTARNKPVSMNRIYFRDLLIRETQGDIDAASAGDVLAQALAPQAYKLFHENAAARKILARVAFLRYYMPEHPWPPFDLPQMQDLLAQAAAGKRSLEQLTESPALANALRSALVYPLDRLVEQHAPETLEVPTGNRIKIEYALAPPDKEPFAVLAVRLQELFGWTETPRIAGGRVPLLLHLLSPGYRPVQITSDLRSFWAKAYFEVRKDLRVQYPKHSWPEDPLTAKAVAKGRSTKT
jgi:ATP-dependent helicase HrpB